jgi:hypothetical protein
MKASTAGGRRPSALGERVIAGRGVAEHLAGYTGALIVVDAYGGGPSDGPLYDRTVEDVLGHIPQPVLVLGPFAPDIRPTSRLVLPADGGDVAIAALDAARRWAARFAPARVEVLALQPPDPWPDESSDPVREPARDAVVELVAGGIGTALRRVVVDGLDAVVVMAAPR